MLGQLLVRTAERFPEKPALTYESRNWNWRQVLTAVDRLVASLLRAGIGPGDEVALWMRNSPTFVFAYFAVLLRGAAVVLCNPAWRAGDCPTRLAVVKVFLTTGDDVAACKATTGSLQFRKPPNYIVYSEFGMEPGKEGADAAAGGHRKVKGEQRALVQVSSGTTGRPKVVVRTHAQCLAEVRHFCDTCSMTERDVVLGILPLFHSHGMANTLWAAAGSGAHLILMKSPQPFALRWEAAVELVKIHGVTVFPGVPMVFQTIVAGGQGPWPMPSVRLCFSAGQPLPKTVYDNFLIKCGVAVRQLYGCTEAGSITINLGGSPRPSWDCVGQPMKGVLVEVQDDDGQVQAAGRTGHVVFQSPATGTYEEDRYSNPSSSAAWFKPGDMGYWDNDRQLHIVGRKEFLFTVGGEKVNIGEIESILQQHSDVAEVAVIGVPDERAENLLVAFVSGCSAIAKDEILQFCRRHLPLYKCPQKIQLIESLPRTCLGKVDREALRRLVS